MKMLNLTNFTTFKHPSNKRLMMRYTMVIQRLMYQTAKGPQ